MRGSVIERVEAIPIAVPRLATPANPAAGRAGLEGRRVERHQRGLVYSTHQESVLVKVTTDDGCVGWGETLASVAPEVATVIIRTLMAPQLIGRNPMAGEALWADLYAAMRDRGHRTGFYIDALAGVDNALWDLRGKRAGLPVYALLGGPVHPSGMVPAYYSAINSPDLETMLAQSDAAVAQGFRALKMHHSGGLRAAAAAARALRERVGDDVELGIDVHNTLRLDEALVLGRTLQELGFRFLEAPTEPEDDNGLRTLAHTLDVPIAYGEGERTRWQFRDRLVHGMIDMVQPDVGYVGISEMRRIAQLAEAFHVSCAPHLSAGMGVCIAAAIHVSAAMPNLYRLEYHPNSFAAGNLWITPRLQIQAGSYVLPDGPGLGVEVNEAALEPFRLTGAAL